MAIKEIRDNKVEDSEDDFIKFLHRGTTQNVDDINLLLKGYMLMLSERKYVTFDTTFKNIINDMLAKLRLDDLDELDEWFFKQRKNIQTRDK